MRPDPLETAHRLADLLTQENAALKQMDFAAAVALCPAKEAALAELAKQPPAAPLPPPLIAVGQLLAKLASENQILLERAITVQTRVVRIVARAYAPPPAATRYGGHGGRSPASLRANALAVSTRA